MQLPPRYRSLTPREMDELFLCIPAEITLNPQRCEVFWKTQRYLPALLEAMRSIDTHDIPRLGNHAVTFRGATAS